MKQQNVNRELAADVANIICGEPIGDRCQILETVLSRQTRCADALTELVGLRKSITEIAMTMDTKSQCILAVLRKIADLEGLAPGLEFAQGLLWSGDDAGAIETGTAQLSHDPDWPTLSRAFTLAVQADTLAAR